MDNDILTRIAQLEAQLAEVAAARDKAERALKARSASIATASHEMRTCLNGILGFAGMLVDFVEDDEHKQWSSAIQNSGEHLLELLNDILDKAKIESGRAVLSLQSEKTVDFFKSAVEIHHAHARKQGLLLVEDYSEAPEFVNIDPKHVRQVVNNLINNAIKFTESGSVTVKVSVVSEGRAKVSVRDTGAGISPSDHELIFEEYRQLDNQQTAKGGGTGLGLPTCREICRLMGTDIKVDSDLGKGCELSFEISST